MNKFLFASMAVLCTILSSCSVQEYDLHEIQDTEFTNKEDLTVTTRSSNTITVNFTDINGNSQSYQCEETRLTYITRTRIEVFIKYANGNTQSELGNDIDIVPSSGSILVTTSPASSFTTSDLQVETCMPECCYTDSNGNNVGTALSIVVEDEPGGF